MEERDFGWALKQLRAGKRVQRSGWNGKGMWLVLIQDWSVGGEAVHHFTKDFPRFQDWIGMRTAQDTFVPWLASQSDVLATDWTIVE